MSEKDAPYGADSVHDFIVRLEGKAKRILKEADKKRREDIRKEHVQQFIRSKSSGSSKKLAQTGSILIPANSSDKLAESTAGFDFSPNKFAGTQIMHYSVPKMVVHMDASTIDLKEVGYDATTTRPISSGQTRRPGSGHATLEPLLSASLNMSVANMEKTNLAVTKKIALTKSKVLEKLDVSPFMSGLAKNLDDFLATGKKSTPKAMIAASSDSTWTLRTHATGNDFSKAANDTFTFLLLLLLFSYYSYYYYYYYYCRFC